MRSGNAVVLVIVLVLLGLPAGSAGAQSAAQQVPQVWLSTDPAVPVVGHKVTVYLYTANQEVAPGYPWDVRARPTGGGVEMPVEMRRIGSEPRFWQGDLVFSVAGDWQIVAAGLQSEPWPAPGTTAGNVLVPVVSGKSALAPNEFNAPWETVMLSGGAGVAVGTLLGWLIGRGKSRGPEAGGAKPA